MCALAPATRSPKPARNLPFAAAAVAVAVAEAEAGWITFLRPSGSRKTEKKKKNK